MNKPEFDRNSPLDPPAACRITIVLTFEANTVQDMLDKINHVNSTLEAGGYDRASADFVLTINGRSCTIRPDGGFTIDGDTPEEAPDA